jgi:hypothetical protein
MFIAVEKWPTLRSTVNQLQVENIWKTNYVYTEHVQIFFFVIIPYMMQCSNY